MPLSISNAALSPDSFIHVSSWLQNSLRKSPLSHILRAGMDIATQFYDQAILLMSLEVFRAALLSPKQTGTRSRFRRGARHCFYDYSEFIITRIDQPQSDSFLLIEPDDCRDVDRRQHPPGRQCNLIHGPSKRALPNELAVSHSVSVRIRIRLLDPDSHRLSFTYRP